MVAKLSAGLGADAIRDGVPAKMYKMLLYDKGPMLKQQQEWVLASILLHPTSS
jgi:hypothetical protein